MTITKEQLKAIMPNAGNRIDLYLPVINKYASEFGLLSKIQMAHFLAQIAHESGELRYTEENLNYSEEALLRVFPKYFSQATAKSYARNPEKIGSRVYANRMGNGDEASGDGFFYRGRGLIQITGKNNYQAYNRYLISTGMDVNLLDYPQLLSGSTGAVKSAMWFFKTHGCLRYAQADDLKNVTLKINGGLNGLTARKNYLLRAKKALGI